MHTVTEIWKNAAAVLGQFEIDTPVIDARLLLQQALGITREGLLLEPKRILSETQQQQFESLLARRLAREPMSQIVGTKEFWGLSFKVTRDTLTPRPDTETVVEAVVKEVMGNRWKVIGEVVHNPSPTTHNPLRILDLGTGTGCLLLSLLHALPNATGTGVDISQPALAVAEENAKSLGQAGRAEFIQGRWCEKISGKYDIIVANPPYIASNALAALMPEVANYEPHLALDGGADGLACYREIARQLPPYMAEPKAGKAIVALEIGAGQDAPVVAVFEAEGFQVEACLPDLAGILRCLILTLT